MFYDRSPEHLDADSDPARIEAAEKARKHAALELQIHTHDVMATYAGRALLWEILSMCGIWHDCAPGDAAAMAHFLGQRNIGLRLNARLLTVDENLYNRMQSEAIERERRRQD